MSHLKLKLHSGLPEEIVKCYQNKVNEYAEMIKNGEKYLDSGFDLFCPENASNAVGEQYKLDTMVSAACYDYGGNPLPYYLYPRSSISKTPLRLANSVGVIDSGYRGHLIAKFDVTHFCGNTLELASEADDDSVKYYKALMGHRLVQITSNDLTPFRSIEIVDDLDVTARGSGGFGSTGQ